MNTIKRLLSQTLLWLFIFLLLWSQQSFHVLFIYENSPVFITQIILLCLLIYYHAPTFLFKKKYMMFIIISLIAVVVLSFLSSIPMAKFPHHQIGRMHRPPPPSRLLIHFLLLLLAYIIGTVIEFVVFTHKKEEEMIVSKNENLQTELKLLKSQINPHFLFNSLNNIYALSAIDVTKTQQSISYLSDMLRYVLYECESAFVPITKEITYIEDYIKLFALKSSKKYPIKTHFSIATGHIEIAPMLFIPFVENAFKHSNISDLKDAFIRLSVIADQDMITFSIENSVASRHIVKDEVGGIGIGNVKKRLSILYPERYDLQIHESNALFKVELKVKNNV